MGQKFGDRGEESTNMKYSERVMVEIRVSRIPGVDVVFKYGISSSKFYLA